MSTIRAALAACSSLFLAAAGAAPALAAEDAAFPYEAAGLGERQAAALLIDRFTFGARPGDVDRVVAMGLDQWLEGQLSANAPDAYVQDRLAGLEALSLTHEALVRRYPTSSQVRAHARRLDLIPGRDVVVTDRAAQNRALEELSAKLGFRTQEEDLHSQLIEQQLVRAVHSENQLREVMTDFWQNHFYVTPTAFDARLWVLAFEGEAVRPNALGHFGDLLTAAVSHPGMLAYHEDLAAPSEIEFSQSLMGRLGADAGPARVRAARDEIAALEAEQDEILSRENWAGTGPNEAFARLILADQTMGAGGGFTDADIAALARMLTGWDVAFYGPTEDWFQGGMENAAALGVEQHGSFLFRSDLHDASAKTLLGETFAAGEGLQQGRRALQVIAGQADTARHISGKIATRFVSETPPEALVDAMAGAFLSSGGDIAAVIRTMAQSEAFWVEAAKRSKIKTPFEYAVSAIRGSDGTVHQAAALAESIGRMGQPLYAYVEPVGYPDRNDYWLDPASLTARFAFAERLSQGRLAGVSMGVDPAAAAPGDLAGLALPERDVNALVAAIEHAAAQDTSPDQVWAMLIASPQFQTR